MTSVPVVSATLTTRTEHVCGQRLCQLPYCKTLTADPAFVVLDQAPDLTCRDCHGTGESIEVAAEGTFEGRHWTSYKLCPSCGGSGVSPVYAATREYRETSDCGFYGTDWDDRPTSLLPGGTVERRQVVEWVARRAEVLPVVKMIGPWTDTFPCIEALGDIKTMCYLYGDDGVEQQFLDEPWAVDLKPGQFVLRLSGWEHLQQPHTEMTCPHCHGHLGDLDRLDEAFWFNGCVEPGSVPECPVCSGKPDTDGYPTGRVPLSVPDWVLSWMELV